MRKMPIYVVSALTVLALLAGCTGVPTPPKRVPALATAASLVEATRPVLASGQLKVTQPPQPTMPALVATSALPQAAPPTLPALVAAPTQPAAAPPTLPTQPAQAAAAGAAAPASTPPAVAAGGGQVDEAAVKTRAYVLPDIGTVNLANGQGDLAQGAGKVPAAHTTYQTATFGDLNGDGLNDAAVLLATNTGGSGTFIYLVALVQQPDGSLNQAAVTLLGDRVQVRSLPILEDKIVLTMVTHGPNDAMCCPTQQVTQTYQLEGNTLKQITAAGETPEATAAPGATPVVTAAAAAATPAPAITAPVVAAPAATASAVAAAQASTPALPPAAATAAGGKVNEAAVKTRAYVLPDIGTVNLVNGQGKLGKGVSAVASAQTTYVTSALGDLNGDGLDDAAGVLATNTGGSGTFIYLIALLQQQDGSLNQAAVTLLGDRLQVKSLAITNGQIVADMVTHGPNDPMCCPTQPVTQVYQLEGKTLKQVSGTSEAPEAAAGPTAAAPAVTAAVPASPTAAATSAPAAGLSGTLTGTVTYRERMALPPQAIIEVTLEDVSRADAPAKALASQNIIVGRKQVPIPFTLRYDPAQIDPKNTYRVAARITEDGQLRWISTQMYPVLTRGAPLSGVEIVVQQVVPSTAGPATPAAGAPTVAQAAPPATPAAPPATAPATATTSARSASLAGTVTLQERLALPNQAVLVVELQDVSEPNAPPLTVAYQIIPTNGQQPPLAFNLQYNPALIDPQGSYVVSARITVGDFLRWINNQPYLVLTQGHPAKDVGIVMHRVIN